MDAKTVMIPAIQQHNGVHSARVTVSWSCPVCGGPRGEVFKTRSYDGSRILNCDGWTNPCGHIDTYTAVIDEAKHNGFNARLEPAASTELTEDTKL